jgi:gamma-glutamyltranspeptidase/glutathione hydrolase
MTRGARVALGLHALATALCTPSCTPSNARRGSTSSPAPFAQTFSREAVAADHPLASQAGAEMLCRGGNAVDAAVAASFCLSVVRPQSCGIGGGGFMLIRLPATERTPAVTTTLNYRETCPAGVGPDFYAARSVDDSRIGGAAVATPGTVAGLLTALERFGTLDRATVLAPAIRAAREGFLADAAFVRAAEEIVEKFRKRPELIERFPFLWTRFTREGALEIGDRVENPEHARALDLVARHGRGGFYAGELARAMVEAVHADGGVLSRLDLDLYRVSEAAPLSTTFRGRTVLSMPPPSSGGVVLAQTLATLDSAAGDADLSPPWSADFTQLFVEALKHSFADRANWLADPAFVELPLAELLDRGMLAGRAQALDRASTHPPEHYGWSLQLPEDGGTSHLCVVDARGGAVACTETINLSFGSWVEVPGFGFLLNNEMDDFTTRRGAVNAFGLKQSDDNLPAPGKRPLSSMTPTIALDASGEVFAVAGASGGPRIISGTLQALVSVLVFDLSAEQAVSRPRWHHQWMPNRLRYEKEMPLEALDSARARGHELEPIPTVGAVQLLRRARSGAGWEAVSDPRLGGRPAGR